ncbi:MAG: hypothetical protein KAG61_03765 [Bacteriovoracaceae bacterium]|nr:hypothetical protein [Bacteriovoracaceae bacterium]
MRRNITDIIPSYFLTLLLLMALDIACTTFFPLVGLTNFRLPFNILIVLYMGFKLEHPTLAILILLTQYAHSFFTLEGWAMGTVAGIIVWMIVSYLRDLLHFSSSFVTGFVTQIFQMIWFLIVAVLIYIKSGDVSYLIGKLWRFIPESLIISFIAPFFFSILDKIWSLGRGGSLGDEV